MKKAIFFINTLDQGGIENYLLRFLAFKQQEFSKVYIYVKSGRKGSLYADFLKIKIVTIIISKVGHFNLPEYSKVFKFLRAHSQYTVCDFSGNIAGPLMAIASIAGLKNRITFYRNSSQRYSPGFLKKNFDRLFGKLVTIYATQIFFNSNAGIDFYFPVHSKRDHRYKIIYNGIDFKNFNCSRRDLRNELKIPKDAFVVGHLGRLDPSKNHKTIFAAAKALIKIDKIYFLMCGKGVKAAFDNSFAGTSIPDKIIILDNISPAIEFFNTIDCFYFPSLTEGNPNALIEAMVCGSPVVASNIKAIKECVPNQYLNFLIEPDDCSKAVQLITKIYMEGCKTDPSATIEMYDSSKWFNLFYDTL